MEEGFGLGSAACVRRSPCLVHCPFRALPLPCIAHSLHCLCPKPMEGHPMDAAIPEGRSISHFLSPSRRSCRILFLPLLCSLALACRVFYCFELALGGLMVLCSARCCSVPSCPADPSIPGTVRPTPLCQCCITVPEGPHVNTGYLQALFARAVKFSVAKTELLLSDLEERFSSSVMVSPGDCFLSAIYVIAVLGFLWIFILHLRFIRRWHVPISRNGARLSCLSWLLKLHAVFLF